MGLELTAFFHSRGILLRPLGNTIYVMPPYCISAEELAMVYAAIKDALLQFA
jgi:adenosylmethionine-8-amino-7-oxononanoate aminotransferase